MAEIDPADYGRARDAVAALVAAAGDILRHHCVDGVWEPGAADPAEVLAAARVDVVERLASAAWAAEVAVDRALGARDDGDDRYRVVRRARTAGGGESGAAYRPGVVIGVDEMDD